MDPLDRPSAGDSHPNPPPPQGDDGAHHLLTAEQAKRDAPVNAPSGLSAPPFALGQYRVVEKIGEGGMGAVYRALHGRLKKAVALKVLPPGRTADAQAVARFEREMEAIGRLNHNHIVRATDAGEADGVHYLVMELIDGIDLTRLVRAAGPLPVAAACELMRQAAVGLQYAHENGLVHRDIKPSNLLLSVNGEVKITDLGLALLHHNERASGELTLSGQVMGTADYMAPEQWEDSHAVDIRADLYSLGCTLYTLLTGRPPFAGPKHRSALRKMAAHARELVKPVTDQRADVPAPVEDLRQRLMNKEPADRPSTPAEVAKALEPFCRGADLSALARTALNRPRSEAAALPDRSTVTRDAVPVLATPAAGQTVTAASAGRWRRTWRPWAAAATGAGLLAAALAVVFRPWPWATERPSADLSRVPATSAPPTPAPPSDAGGWQRLLAEPPVERVWKPAVDSRLDHDPAKEILWIQTASIALIRLGQTDARGYKLQVGLRQPRWVGGVGVYFGGRQAAGPNSFHFQLIELQPSDPNNVRVFRLGRSVGLVLTNPGTDPQVGNQGFANWPLPEPPDNSEHLLELEVKPPPRGLVGIRWNGRPCPQLITDAVRNADPQADDRGEFGIYCSGGSVIVSTARLMNME